MMDPNLTDAFVNLVRVCTWLLVLGGFLLLTKACA